MSGSDDGPNLDAAQHWQETLEDTELRERALTRFFREVGDVTDRNTGLAEEALFAASEISRLREQLSYLEAQVERLETRQDAQADDSKSKKIADIVQFALNKRPAGNPVVKLTPHEIKGVTGVSRRYAYDLVDDLPDEYDWCMTPQEMQQYGQIELDLSAQEKRLGIDIEGVHSSGCPVNKFTTATGGKAGSDGEEVTNE